MPPTGSTPTTGQHGDQASDVGRRGRPCGVRVVAAPQVDPPFDDGSRPAVPTMCVPTAPAAAPWSRGASDRPLPARPGRRARNPPHDPGNDADRATPGPGPGPRPGPGPGPEHPPRSGARATGAPGPAGQAAVRRYVNLCLEVINGFRPVAHLRPLTDPRHFSGVADQLRRRASRLHRPADRTALATLRRLRATQPAAGAVEAVVVIDHDGRSWAMALRMEQHQHGWRCCVLQVV